MHGTILLIHWKILYIILPSLIITFKETGGGDGNFILLFGDDNFFLLIKLEIQRIQKLRNILTKKKVHEKNSKTWKMS